MTVQYAEPPTATRTNPRSLDRSRRQTSLVSSDLILPAVARAFKMLNPLVMMRNPVMFITEIGAAVTTLITIQSAVTGQSNLGYFGVKIDVPTLVALLVCLIPTTIGALLAAIGIAGMARLGQKNVLAMSGRAAEAAGAVDVLLLDKTGTVTLGNRQASEFIRAPGVTLDVRADAAQLSSLADETPEGRSIVVLAKNRYGLRGRDIEKLHARFVPFTAQTRMSGIDLDGKRIRKGAAEAIEKWVRSIPIWRLLYATHIADRQVGTDGVSTKTANYYLQSMKQFCRWMVRDRRAPDSPVEHLNGKKAEKAQQRALEPNAVRCLLETTGAGRKRYGMTGRARAMLYRLAAESGLRANELRSLTKGAFDFANHTVTVTCTNTKNRNRACLPLRSSTAGELQAFLADKTPNARAFRLPSKHNMARMLRRDMADAGLPCSSDAKSEDYVNFHSLRHTTGSLLAAAGVHPKVIQTIMRHSDINLTMGVYTHTSRGQETQAIESLPELSLPSAAAVELAAGTDGRIVRSVSSGSEELTPKLTPQLTPAAFSACSRLTSDGTPSTEERPGEQNCNLAVRKHLDIEETRLTPVVAGGRETRPEGSELYPFRGQKCRFLKRAAQNPAHPAHKTPPWTPTWLSFRTDGPSCLSISRPPSWHWSGALPTTSRTKGDNRETDNASQTA